MRAILLVPLVLAGVLGLAAADRESGVLKWLELREGLAVAQARIADLRRETAALQRQIEDLTGDPLALERAIREDLGLARPGEVVIRFERRGKGAGGPRRPESRSHGRGE